MSHSLLGFQGQKATGANMPANCQGDGVFGQIEVCAPRFGCKELLVS